MKYEIADYLPVNACLNAVVPTYTHAEGGGVVRVTEEGYCPLGWAIWSQGWDIYPCPDPKDVYRALKTHRPNTPGRAFHAIRTFMADWDHGRITNLAEALDVQS